MRQNFNNCGEHTELLQLSPDLNNDNFNGYVSWLSIAFSEFRGHRRFVNILENSEPDYLLQRDEINDDYVSHYPVVSYALTVFQRFPRNIDITLKDCVVF